MSASAREGGQVTSAGAKGQGTSPSYDKFILTPSSKRYTTGEKARVLVLGIRRSPLSSLWKKIHLGKEVRVPVRGQKAMVPVPRRGVRVPAMGQRATVCVPVIKSLLPSPHQ